MIKEALKILINEIKKANGKAFFTFLFCSAFFWVLVQFSKDYTQIVSLPVEFENYPKDKTIDKKGDEIELRAHQSGFQFAWFKLFRPTIQIDLSELPDDNEEHLTYNLIKNHNRLEQQIPLNINDVEFLDDEIIIPYKKRLTKTVPIVSEVKIKYASGYASEKGIEIVPDSIMVSGSEELLDSITEVKTKSKELKRVKKSVNGKIQLKSPHAKATLFEDEVDFLLNVEKFTENKVNVPLEIINAPPNKKITLYPPSVDIKFKVSLNRFKQIKESDFKVICDYQQLSDEQDFFIPKIEEQPKNIRGVTIFPQKVEYLIKK